MTSISGDSNDTIMATLGVFISLHGSYFPGKWIGFVSLYNDVEIDLG